MSRLCVLFSGPIASGKSTLIKEVENRYHNESMTIKTSEILSNHKGFNRENTRENLQEFGDQLDRNTNHGWLAQHLIKTLFESDKTIIFLDSVRKLEQIAACKESKGIITAHIHVTANEETLTKRLQERHRSDLKDVYSIQEARKNITESNVDSLQAYADIVLETDATNTTELSDMISALIERVLNDV